MLYTVKKPTAVDRSYQLLALLRICEISAQYVAEPANPDHVAQVGSSLANVLEVAHEFAGEIHDNLEGYERANPKQVAS